MHFIKTLFWNHRENRFRVPIRILLLITLAGILANLFAILGSNLNSLLENSFSNFLIMLGILGAIYLIGTYVDKREWSEFGITLIPLKQFIYGSILGTFLVCIIIGVQYALGWLTLKEMYYNSLPSNAFIWVIAGQLLRYFCGSIFEESFTRGYLFLNLTESFTGNLSKNQAAFLSYLITSSIFGLLHFANDNSSWLSTLNLVLLGLLFGWYVLKTGKLHFAIGLHAFWNIFQNNVFGFANSGKPSIVSIYSFNNTGDTLWTGGEFGIEGGLLCTITIASMLLLFVLRSKSKRPIKNV